MLLHMANVVFGSIVFGVAFVSSFYEFAEPTKGGHPYESRFALIVFTIWAVTLVREIIRRNYGRPDNDGD